MAFRKRRSEYVECKRCKIRKGYGRKIKPISPFGFLCDYCLPQVNSKIEKAIEALENEDQDVQM